MGLTLGQQQCVDTFGKPLVVAAGAGSGKTFTLTKRIVNAFEAGQVTDIDQVLAITFTNKAAAELKGRIKGSLRAAGRIDQALKVDDAWISTIHGMCSRILREHALELGIDPLFEVMPGDKRDRARDEAIRAVIADPQQCGASEDDVSALFAEYGRGDAVADMICRLVEVEQSSTLGSKALVAVPAHGSPALLLGGMLDAARDLLALTQTLNDSTSKLRREDELACAIGLIEQALEQPDLSAQRALELADLLPKSPGSMGGADYKAQANGLVDCLKAGAGNIAALIAHRHLLTLMALADCASKVFTAAKLSRGYLDSNDLVVLAAKALQDHPGIAALYADRFKLVMVDEFQDTDQLQVDLISRLAGSGCERLCTVGDSQQSIYRFRGADLNVYRNHLTVVQQRDPDAVIELFDNFRSHGDVLGFVDRIFSQPLGFGGEFKRLVPRRDEARVPVPFASDGPRIMVDVTVGKRSTAGASSDDLLVARAVNVAQRFANLRDAGHRAGDMVVLLGRMTASDVYAQALRNAGFDVVVAGGSVFAALPEPAMVSALASCLADMTDGEALLCVLQSDLFGLDDHDLALMCTSDWGEGRFSRRELAHGLFASSKQEGLSDRACRACELLFAAGRDARVKPLSQVLMDVLIDSGWVARCEARGPEGQASAANAYKAVRMVADIEAEEHCGILELARRFAMRLEGVREAPGALSATGGDSVRIMTIHASKGLEFPIVAVSEVGDKGYRSSRLVSTHVGRKTHVSLAIDPGNYSASGNGLAAEVSKGVAAGLDELDNDQLAQLIERTTDSAEQRAAIIEREKREEEAESLRLLYVALTRAKESLVVELSTTATAKDALGCSKGTPALLQGALFGPRGRLEVGSTMVDIGCERPVHVTCALLYEQTEQNDEAPEGDEAATLEAGADAPEPLFFVPDAPRESASVTEAYRTPGAALQSYSSLASAGAHPQGLYERVEAAQEPVFKPAAQEEPALWPQVEFSFDDQQYERVPVGAERDSDDATDFGSAFHLLAQMAARVHAPGRLLAKPDPEQVAHVAAVYGLDERGLARLDAALDHWFASAAAEQAAACDSLGAEVPFAFSVGEGRWTLEGSIDLLGCRESGGALVVDYKTGGSDSETPAQLRAKHALQGAVYATSILLQGAPEVDLAFVRVEREDADNPGQPQVVRYRYEAGDLPWLVLQLVEACEQAGE